MSSRKVQGPQRSRKKKGMVTHPRVLTQRTPVLRSGDILSLLRTLLSRFFRSGFLLSAAFLCSCHIVHLLSLNFTSYTRYCSAATLVYKCKCYTTYCCIYLHNRFLSTFFFAKKQIKTANADPVLESGCQSQFQDRAFNTVCVRVPFLRGALHE